MKAKVKGSEDIIIQPVVPDDVQEILSLQKLAYQTEAELFDDKSVSPLTETIEGMKRDFETYTFFKAMIGGELIGSVRTYVEGDVCYVSRLILNPIYQHHGIGKRLVKYVEGHYKGIKRIELFTFSNRKDITRFYKDLDYKIFKKEKVSDKLENIYFEKVR
ncbi:GNAT family N-acetyltransferase [Candidatus Auribacterota bacterium]